MAAKKKTAKKKKINPNVRIRTALEYAIKYGGIDGAHHKDWVIDQMVRALTGCPIEVKTKKTPEGYPFVYDVQGESKEYQELVRKACAGEDGPSTYSWSIGIPP